ncbi:outer membrane protein transport protein [Vibrio sp. TH_r3]|uniref:outer membrane protein transport protein n=1 Tax=Vibrio sp. TH_r3 TaxID=3082084 RepID=UPI002953D9B7|nr:outer membrane protein transport protein [Vibrio sp. TH_r3]MDV7103185.1 outer membrane protein transport protein [Vibrio sp. TH_r3]
MKVNKTLVSLAVFSAINTFGQTAAAAGFQLGEYSATGLGRAFAGEAAMADNAASQWRNPALLTYLEGTQLSAGASYVNPNVDVNGEVTYAGNSYDANSSDYADDAIIPNIYISHKLNDKTAIGFALGTNYGMATDLGDDFAASHYGDTAEVTTMEANFNLAYQITPAVSIGGGIRYITAEGHFGATAPSQAPSGYEGETLKYMQGDTTDWGWQIGTVWQINQRHRVGFAYKSEVDLKLKGTAEGIGFGLSSGASVSGYLPLTLPATAELASMLQLSDRTTITASINWTDWSSFKKLEATLDGAYGTQLVKDENWQDSYRFAVGAEYQVNKKWLLRSGIAYDTSAVNDENRTATIPETDRTWLSIGAGYAWSPKLNFDAGFAYILAKNASISEPRGSSDLSASALGGSYTSEVSGNVWVLGAQASYLF